MIGPTPISEIADFQSKVFIEFRSTFLGSFFLDLLLHILWIEHFFVQIKCWNLAIRSCFSAGSSCIGSLGSLTLFEFLPIESELVHLLGFLLNVLCVELIVMWNGLS